MPIGNTYGHEQAASSARTTRGLRATRLSMISLWLALTAFPVCAQDQPQISPSLAHALKLVSGQRMLEDIRTLSGPALNGRQTGTADDLASAEFVRQQFLDLRGRPPLAPESGSESAPVLDQIHLQSTSHRATIIAEQSLLHLAITPDSPPEQIGEDYLPVLDAPSAEVKAAVVFVGYGISDPEAGFDEYAGLDVHNKVVLFLRGKPERYSKPVSHADKVHAAQTHGALAYLTTTGPILTAYEARRGLTGRPSAFYGLPDPQRTIPGAWINTTRAIAILQRGRPGDEDRLRALQQSLNEGHGPQSTATNAVATMRWQSTEHDGLLHNVIALLPGSDAANTEEALVIGAHRDHFGRQGGLLFAGADDNASGTAVLLEVARVLHATAVKPKRSTVFVSFSGEEQGLLGSKFYVREPVIPLRSTIAMINIDHAAVGNGRLTIGATGMEKLTAQQVGRQAGLEDRLDVFGFFPGGDHVPFKEAGVATVTVVSGGIHPHFHQPTDTAETVNPDILTAAARYVLAMLWQLADVP